MRTPSTDTFYGILCSGLTDKTKLSFTSSNSSFTEYVRQQPLHLLSPHTNTHGETEDVEWWNEESFNNQSKIQFSSSTAGSFKFTDCCWEHCTTNGNGGAICLTSSNSILTVLRGIFIDCNTTSHYGGGIYVENCAQFHASESLFYQCHSTTLKNDYGGAGISIRISNIDKTVIMCCSFIDSDSTSDSGGMTIYSSNGVQSTLPIRSSTFIKCRSLSVSPEGGAVCYWENNVTIGMSDSLFSQCNATNGGGIFMSLPTTPSEEIIKFCFFHANTVTRNGKDVCLFGLPSNYMPLLQCLTTSSGNTVNEHENTNDHSNWLPAGTVKYKQMSDLLNRYHITHKSLSGKFSFLF